MVTVRTTTTGFLGGGGDDLAAAAGIVADAARGLASAWSVQIPADISVRVSGNVATISSDVGPAYPGETRARHPLFGNREYWYGPPGEPFLRPAADSKADAAMQRYAQKADTLARAAGFE